MTRLALIVAATREEAVGRAQQLANAFEVVRVIHAKFEEFIYDPPPGDPREAIVETRRTDRFLMLVAYD